MIVFFVNSWESNCGYYFPLDIKLNFKFVLFQGGTQGLHQGQVWREEVRGRPLQQPAWGVQRSGVGHRHAQPLRSPPMLRGGPPSRSWHHGSSAVKCKLKTRESRHVWGCYWVRSKIHMWKVLSPWIDYEYFSLFIPQNASIRTFEWSEWLNNSIHPFIQGQANHHFFSFNEPFWSEESFFFGKWK